LRDQADRERALAQQAVQNSMESMMVAIFSAAETARKG
jgi:hypothetical protein